jgi:nucleotide-binding universal stress UspA family protein
MYEKILVPLDGSQLAEVALPYAEELAGKLGSEVFLLYVSVFPEYPDPHMARFYLDKVVETTKQGAARWIKKPAGRAIVVKSAILVGNPGEQIVGYAEKEDIGLIVIATHGQSGIKRWALGSVADRVLRATTKPVALIRAKGARPDVREMGIVNTALVPLDGSKEGEAVIPYVEELASKLKAKVILLQVLATGYQTPNVGGFANYVVFSEQQMESAKTYARDYLNKVGALLKEKGVTVATEVRLSTDVTSINAAEEIIDFANKANVDVVAMSTHGRSGFGRWVFGSVADRVLHEGNTPLLLVRETADNK